MSNTFIKATIQDRIEVATTGKIIQQKADEMTNAIFKIEIVSEAKINGIAKAFIELASSVGVFWNITDSRHRYTE